MLRSTDGRLGRRLLRLAMVLTITATLLTSCGSDGTDPEDGGTASPTPGPSVETSATAASSEEIRIETDLTVPTGKVRSESVIGGSPFCAGGTFRDEPGPSDAPVLKTFSCPEGELKIGFSPGEPEGLTQKGPWSIVPASGTGSFKGLQGSGEGSVTFKDDGPEGRETFTGTVTR